MIYDKNFDKWNFRKKELNSSNRQVFFHEREVWWCSTGVNIGNEQDGKEDYFQRPVLIYRKINRNIFIGIPFTSVLNEGNLQFTFYFDYNIHSMLVQHIRSYDSKRLIRKIGKVSDYIYNKTKKAVTRFLC